jgi:HTH-type transcriptional regulator, competence development regulator
MIYMGNSNRLGLVLRRLRETKGVSLRAVEKGTGISNAYLSQLERGVATNPTPAKLQALAKYLNAQYLDLLSYAGYLPNPRVEDSVGLIASSADDSESTSTLLADLTADEEALVSQYIDFLKSQRTRLDRMAKK